MQDAFCVIRDYLSVLYKEATNFTKQKVSSIRLPAAQTLSEIREIRGLLSTTITLWQPCYAPAPGSCGSDRSAPCIAGNRLALIWR